MSDRSMSWMDGRAKKTNFTLTLFTWLNTLGDRQDTREHDLMAKCVFRLNILNLKAKRFLIHKVGTWKKIGPPVLACRVNLFKWTTPKKHLVKHRLLCVFLLFRWGWTANKHRRINTANAALPEERLGPDPNYEESAAFCVGQDTAKRGNVGTVSKTQSLIFFWSGGGEMSKNRD